MNKYFLIFTVYFFLAFSLNSTSAQDKIQFFSDNIESKNTYGINEFYFIHQIFAEAFFRTGLYKQLDYEEMNKIIKEILFKTDKKNKLTVLIHQKDKSDGKLEFSITENSQDEIVLTMMTNYETNSRTFTKEADANSLTRWYFIKGEKLVYNKDLYSIEKEKRIAKGEELTRRFLIEYFLYDDNFENDSKVKGLIDEILNDKDARKIDVLYAKLYLVEYYLLNSKIELADKELKYLKEYFEENNEKGIPYIYSSLPIIAEAEVELMKRIKNN